MHDPIQSADPSVYASLYMFDSGEAELATHESAAGAMVFEVNYGTDVEVELASIATRRRLRSCRRRKSNGRYRD